LNTWAWWTAPGSHVPICIDETWEISSSGSCYVGGAIAILKNIREGLSHILWKNMFETTSHMIFESHTEVERITNHLLKCTYQVSSPGGIIFVLRSTQWISHFWQVMNSMGLEVVRIIKPLGNPPLDNCKFCMSSSLLHLHFLYPPVFSTKIDMEIHWNPSFLATQWWFTCGYLHQVHPWFPSSILPSGYLT
jgi:hypothetical protein